MSSSSSTRSRSRRTPTMVNNVGGAPLGRCNPIFEQAAEYINDDYWKEMLIDAADGKFPTNFMLNNTGYLMYKKKGTTTVVHDKILLSEDPMQIAEDFITFIKKNAKLYSKADYVRMKREYNLGRDGQEKKTSKKITSETINVYVSMCEKAWGMTPEQSNSLRITIKNGFDMGILEAYSLIENGVIHRVDYIQYDNYRECFYIDPVIISVPKTAPRRIRSKRLDEPTFTVKRVRTKFETPISGYISLNDIIDTDEISQYRL